MCSQFKQFIFCSYLCQYVEIYNNIWDTVNFNLFLQEISYTVYCMSELFADDGHCPYVGKYHLTSKFKAVYVTIGSLSIIAAIFIWTTIFSIKKLRAHPSVMIGYISLFEAISWFHSVVWAISTMEYIDYFGLQYLLKYTIAFNSTTLDTCNALWQLNQISYLKLSSLPFNFEESWSLKFFHKNFM